MSVNATKGLIRYTSSREADNALRVARVAAAGRIAAERKAREAEHAAEHAAFLLDLSEGSTEDFCHVCRRCTDHRGEHTDAQIGAWIERTGGFPL